VLTERVQRWREDGAVEEVHGRKLFVRRRGGGDGILLLFLHGFPSSSYDWLPLLELRPPGEATLCFDFLGFGLSEKPRDHEYTLAWQADAAEELVRRAGSPSVFVVGHDMGTSVATELMARDLRGELGMNMAGALLFNGSMLLHLAKPTLGQKLLRGHFVMVAAIGPEAAGAELLVQQASEETRDEEEQRHAEDVRDEAGVAEQRARRVVDHGPDARRQSRQEGHRGVERHAQQQGEAAHRVERMKALARRGLRVQALVLGSCTCHCSLPENG